MERQLAPAFVVRNSPPASGIARAVDGWDGATTTRRTDPVEGPRLIQVCPAAGTEREMNVVRQRTIEILRFIYE